MATSSNATAVVSTIEDVLVITTPEGGMVVGYANKGMRLSERSSASSFSLLVAETF